MRELLRIRNYVAGFLFSLSLILVLLFVFVLLDSKRETNAWKQGGEYATSVLNAFEREGVTVSNRQDAALAMEEHQTAIAMELQQANGRFWMLVFGEAAIICCFLGYLVCREPKQGKSKTHRIRHSRRT